jgi:predicted nucleic acid-binding Zn ribbon protein
MDKDTRLRNAVKWPRARTSCGTVRLDQAVRELVDEQIFPRQARFSQVAEVWGQLLPAQLARHCEIADLSGGQLDVQVDSPSYMYELQLCSSELLKELQRQCPKVRLTRIKFVVA